MIIEKPWGSSERLIHDYTVQLERIQIVKGGYSSKHWHKRKRNLFWVTSGKLAIYTFVFNKDGPHVEPHKVARSWLLTPANAPLCIEPDIIHQFVALERTLCYEMYVAGGGHVEPEDIVRLSANGIFSDDDLLEIIKEVCQGDCNA